MSMRIRIDDLEQRYELREIEGDPDLARERLDRVFSAALEAQLEAALQRAGLGDGEELCVRALETPPLEVSLHSSDEALGVAWCDAFAAAVLASVDAGGPAVVRYASRAQARLDVAAGVASGHFERDWAWRQLALWPLPEGGAPRREAAAAVARMLASERAVVPVLQSLARRGLLAPLFDALDPVALRVLVVSALDTAGVPPIVAAAVLELAPDRLGRGERVPDPTWGEGSPNDAAAGDVAAAWTMAAMFARTALFQESRRWLVALSPPGGTAIGRRVAAILSLLAVEPSALNTVLPAIARRRVLEVERMLAGPEAVEPPAASAREAPSTNRSAYARDPAASDVDFGPVEDRCVGRTAEAGLLFFLHLMSAARVVDTALTDSRLGARPLRWTLHAIALALRPLDARDPAALAFCGVAPDPAPTGSQEPAANDQERMAVDELAAALVEALRARLASTAEEWASAPRERLLALVCRRRGEVVADPGWFEIRLELDEVSTEVRRAGLDLDPDWVSWLGAVVRFRYA